MRFMFSSDSFSLAANHAIVRASEDDWNGIHLNSWLYRDGLAPRITTLVMLLWVTNVIERSVTSRPSHQSLASNLSAGRKVARFCGAVSAVTES
jgi:hypothetical protein